jgi:hypothetical protein
MSSKKVIRDAIIVIVIVAVLVIFFGSRRPGPVESISGTIPSDGSGDGQAMPPVHGEPYPELNEGDALVTLNNLSIGSDWFDRMLDETEAQIVDEGTDEETALHQAKFEVLLLGLQELVIRNAIDEFGIEPDPEMIAEQEQNFRSSFETDEEIDEFLAQMGMTMERVRTMWEDQSIMAGLRIYLAETQGIDPDSDEADQYMSDWIHDAVLSADFVFHDSDLETLYEGYRTMSMEGLLGEEPPTEFENPDSAVEDAPVDSDNM